jgi:HSP20 family protein
MAKKSSRTSEKAPSAGFSTGFGGILKGLSDLVEKLDELKESGGNFSKTGEIHGDGQQLKGIYGFTVKVGLGDDGQPRVEPFGNIRQESKSGRTVVQEVREPVADVFEEDGHVLVVAEMPGISAADVSLEVVGDLLTISAGRGDKKYRKEVLLPESIPREKIQITCNNGVVEIRCPRAQ